MYYVGKVDVLCCQHRSSMLATYDYGNEDVNPYYLIIKELVRQFRFDYCCFDKLYLKDELCK